MIEHLNEQGLMATPILRRGTDVNEIHALTGLHITSHYLAACVAFWTHSLGEEMLCNGGWLPSDKAVMTRNIMALMSHEPCAISGHAGLTSVLETASTGLVTFCLLPDHLAFLNNI